jgi:hypothetical protein
MEFCNCIDVKKFSFRYKHFCFIDTKEYAADALFAKYKVHVRFGSEYRKEGSNFCFIFCKVPKKEADIFKEALEELKRKILLLGHSEYPKVCESFMTDLIKLQV